LVVFVLMRNAVRPHVAPVDVAQDRGAQPARGVGVASPPSISDRIPAASQAAAGVNTSATTSNGPHADQGLGGIGHGLPPFRRRSGRWDDPGRRGRVSARRALGRLTRARPAR
jgi:hypothetical protein